MADQHQTHHHEPLGKCFSGQPKHGMQLHSSNAALYTHRQLHVRSAHLSLGREGVQEACCRPRGPPCNAGAIKQVHPDRRPGMRKQVPCGCNTCKAAAYDGVPSFTLACTPPNWHFDAQVV